MKSSGNKQDTITVIILIIIALFMDSIIQF